MVCRGIRLARRREVAIKVEPCAAEDQQLEEEYQVYSALAGGAGIPKVLWFGAECNFNIMVLDLLGPSLEDLFNVCHRRFTLKTVLMLADQLVSIVCLCGPCMTYLSFRFNNWNTFISSTIYIAILNPAIFS